MANTISQNTATVEFHTVMLLLCSVFSRVRITHLCFSQTCSDIDIESRVPTLSLASFWLQL